jgi:hypothetical protein
MGNKLNGEKFQSRVKKKRVLSNVGNMTKNELFYNEKHRGNGTGLTYLLANPNNHIEMCQSFQGVKQQFC